MKAVFKRYNIGFPFFTFTKGNKYDVNHIGFVIDDNGRYVSINSGAYEFEIIEDDYFIKEPASLKYFINDIRVDKGFFYESIGELNEAERLGVKVPSVKFEIKFE